MRYLIEVAINQGPEETVPKRKNIPVIAIGPRTLKVMMEFMEVRCHKHQPQETIQRTGDSYVCMGQISKHDCYQTIDEIVGERDTHQCNRKQRSHVASNCIARVMAKPCLSINICVCVVNHMQPPQPSYSMK